MQKSGTSALARYLAAHPALALPDGKEAHVFDAPDFDDAWTVAEVDARFAGHFRQGEDGRLRGDATPATVFFPEAIARAHRYHPGLKWILVLRDPVERALSQFHMARSRGNEPLGLLAALVAEPWRLWRSRRDPGRFAMRKQSYVARSRYARQLDCLYRHFPPSQVLLLRTADLGDQPARTVDRVCAFLGVDPMPDGVSFDRVFVGDYRRPSPWSPGLLYLRLRLAGEVRRLARRHGLDLSREPAG